MFGHFKLVCFLDVQEPSIPCEFDVEYMCDYRNAIGNKRNWSLAEEKDIKDYDLRNAATGRFLVAEGDSNENSNTTVYSPKFKQAGSFCVQFNWFLLVAAQPYPDFGFVVDLMEGSIFRRREWWSATDSTKGWQIGQFDVKAGKENHLAFVKMFAAATVGLDNVTLSPGECKTLDCPAESFTCADKCLPASKKCDKNDQCVKGEDESTCGRNASCDFETPYHCGYQNDINGLFKSVKEVWTGTSRVFERTPKKGSDTFMGFVGRDAKVVYFYSPPLPLATSHCLRFYFFGSPSVTFLIYSNDQQVFQDTKFAEPEHWRPVEVTIPPGEIYITFYLYLSYTYYFGIDEFLLKDGACSNVLDCGAGFFTCTSERKCLPEVARCNGNKDCRDGEDEQNCPNSISCNFEHHFKCGYKSESPWGWSAASRLSGPATDHTYKDSLTITGHFMLFRAATRQFTTLVSPTMALEDGCIEFYYYLHGGVSALMNVHLRRNGRTELVFSDNGFGRTNTWNKGYFNVTKNTYDLLFSAHGDAYMHTASEVAIDDILHSPTPCKPREPCNAYDTVCTGNAVCVPYSLQNDGMALCDDGSDEKKEPDGDILDECDFEIAEPQNDAKCDFRQTYHDYEWTRISGATPSSYTGPLSAYKGSYYMYIEASGQENRVATFERNYTSDTSLCMTFAFHIYGESAGHLEIDVRPTHSYPLWRAAGDHGALWFHGVVDLPPAKHGTITISGKTSNRYTSDVAIDDIKIIESSCETAGKKLPPLRLVGGDMKSKGRVEIAENYVYAAVCSNQWTVNNTRVACRTLGFTGDFKMNTLVESEYGRGMRRGAFAYDCFGNETNLSECRKSSSNCDGEGVSIMCSQSDCFAGYKLCSANSKCIEEHRWCDGNVDCPKSEDEHSCATCKKDEFECHRTHRCVKLSVKCDSTNDCGDMSDEHECVRYNNDKTVTITHQGVSQKVCATEITDKIANTLCASTGRGVADSFSSHTSTVSPGYQTAEDLTVQSITSCAALLLACKHPECGKPEVTLVPETMIIQGTDAVPKEWPWMGSLSLDSMHKCGATVISNQWILTAQHCIEDINTKSLNSDGWRLYFGEIDKNKFEANGTRVGFEQIVPHPEAVVTSSYIHADIALVKVTPALVFSDRIKPVCLAPPHKDLEHSYSNVFITGWGQDESRSYPNTLQETRVTIHTSTDECEDVVKETVDVAWSDTGICVNNQNYEMPACRGDSGGPLVGLNEHGRWELVGIMSYGNPSCGYSPSVYQNVPGKFYDWIRNVTGLSFH